MGPAVIELGVILGPCRLVRQRVPRTPVRFFWLETCWLRTAPGGGAVRMGTGEGRGLEIGVQVWLSVQATRPQELPDRLNLRRERDFFEFAAGASRRDRVCATDAVECGLVEGAFVVHRGLPQLLLLKSQPVPQGREGPMSFVRFGTTD